MAVKWIPDLDERRKSLFNLLASCFELAGTGNSILTH